jgi:hypothetical protein
MNSLELRPCHYKYIAFERSQRFWLSSDNQETAVKFATGALRLNLRPSGS